MVSISAMMLPHTCDEGEEAVALGFAVMEPRSWSWSWSWSWSLCLCLCVLQCVREEEDTSVGGRVGDGDACRCSQSDRWGKGRAWGLGI
jgi:hypothetical protein